MSIYQFQNNALNGKPFDNAALQGKVVLVFNTASKCGLTYHLEGLESLYKTYKDRGLVVVGFPCNQFAKQEPGSAEEIESFCKKNYGVSFPIMEKIKVNGDNQAPIYQYLKEQTGNEDIAWNFEKFLIGKDGKVVERFNPKTEPKDLIPAIEKLL
ncbi:hypothetical protein HDV01_002097 [Terramyces sp. JEL0728]|nr:hypothetical protein HDV01_002097 [Terramyces sp. JEL0728]